MTTIHAPAGTAINTVELTAADAVVDLVAVAGADGFLFERDGIGVAGAGLETRVPARDAAALVARLGPEAVAVGALPFRHAGGGLLAIPALVVRRHRRAGTTITTITTTDGRDPLDALATAVAHHAERPHVEEPDSFSLHSTISHAAWRDLVDDATKEIENGHLEKVVLARAVEVEANRSIDLNQVIARLRALYPSCTTFSIDGFVGASPELLVRRQDRGVWSHPLAGTVARSGDPTADRRLADGLLRSGKDRAEHRLVVEAVAAVLRSRCDELSVPSRPTVVALRNVAHLGTLIDGVLTEPKPSALELALALHPTPAVGGSPTEAALTYLDDEEGLDRGRYAGPVGWVDGRGDGEWVVGIRSADIDGSRARLCAGVGVVAGSDAEAELAETQLKLQALLAALVRP